MIKLLLNRLSHLKKLIKIIKLSFSTLGISFRGIIFTEDLNDDSSLIHPTLQPL